MDLGLKGKRAIVTGGTRGIGRAIVDVLIDEGCDIAFCARNQDEVFETHEALSNSNTKIISGVVDVAQSSPFRNWIVESAEELGGLDILIANASALGVGADEEAWRTSLEVDILGTVRAVEAAQVYLERSNAAAICAISSTASINTAGRVRAYSGAKAALINYISGLSTNLSRKGIRANTVSPGAVYFPGGVWDSRKKNMPEMYDAAIKASPSGRLCRPEEVANAVAFLVSPAASFISGTNIIVDGGSTTRVQF